MATTIKVKNFQSIKNATIEIDGFTVVTGSNNSGKTALQRAIRGAFENTRGHAFVRHGETHSEVSVSFSDGNKVTWYKGAKENKYVVNGKTYDKVGHGVPDCLTDLGVFPLTCGGKNITPQFAPQFTGQVFLLNETGSTLAEAISDVERVSLLNKALKESERDKRSIKSELKVRKSDKKKLEQSLSLYDGLDAVGEALQEMEEREKALNDLLDQINELKSLSEKYQTIQATIEKLQGIDSFIFDIPSPNKELDQILKCVSILEGLKQRHIKANNSVTLLESVLDNLGDIDVLGDTNKVSSLERCSNGIALLTNLFDKEKQTRETVLELQALIGEKESELIAVETEFHDTLKNHESCPLCGVTL